MNLKEQHNETTKSLALEDDESTFRSIFAPAGETYLLNIPDYQRAYSWDEKQIVLFINDLVKFHSSSQKYYYGHFIAEKDNECWEIVDGQQRITTFVLFLLVCKNRDKDQITSSAKSLIDRFNTVSYDKELFCHIKHNLRNYLESSSTLNAKSKTEKSEIIKAFSLNKETTRSIKRIALALHQFNQAFEKENLKNECIQKYIEVVMNSLSSHHITRNKTVAINIFEMHNTRGVALTTIEKVKALLMRVVYENGNNENERNENIIKIQDQFGEIHRMEELLAEKSFRGKTTIDQLLRLHLRVIDDRKMMTESQLNDPPMNADGTAMIEYIEKQLKLTVDKGKHLNDAVDYAINLAVEFKKSINIMAHHLPEWDKKDKLVGDVLILDRNLSCEFFLIICRKLAENQNDIDGEASPEITKLWERFLFIRNFHNAYRRLHTKDNFPKLFSDLSHKEKQISKVLESYLSDGFRPERAKNLVSLVYEFIKQNKSKILQHAYHWNPWRHKINYAIYKYETNYEADIREVMKETISVEHILPLAWNIDWIEHNNGKLNNEDKEQIKREVNSYINGIGNLLLLTPADNTGEGNDPPAKKKYKFKSGSYAEHDNNRKRWERSSEWPKLIEERGNLIYKFILNELIGPPEGKSTTTNKS